MLASITHDLQTQLTRLRLRLERIGDETLRQKFVADLSAMSALIDEGWNSRAAPRPQNRKFNST